MGDCAGATQSECRRLFPVTAFDLVIMVSLQNLQPLFPVYFEIQPRALIHEGRNSTSSFAPHKA